MARTVRNAKIDSRSARTKLAARGEPYWTKISKGCFVGYRKGERGGTWIGRYRDVEGRQRYKALGAADDAMDADGIKVLKFDQAQGAARDWFEKQARIDAGADEPKRPLTVRDVIDLYIEAYSAEGKSVSSTKYVVEAHILPTLGDLVVQELTTARIRKWRDRLAGGPARVRSGRGTEQAYKPEPRDPETIRQRRSTANRILTILRAALNYAWQEGKVSSDDAWRRVRPFKEVDAARVRYLNQDECKRLVNASDPEIRPMVQGALLTGCRYGELASLKVADFNQDAETLLVRITKTGKPRHVVLTEDGGRYFYALAVGREADDLMFKKDNGMPWGRSHQGRPLAEACARAKIKPAANFHALRHTYASHAVMGGVPLQVIAGNLGHADIRMVEKHYGHLAPSYRAERIRAGAPTLGVVEKSKISPLQRKAH